MDRDVDESPVVFASITDEEATMIKKIILSHGKFDETIKVQPINFKEARIEGKQFVMSVPKDLVYELKEKYNLELRKMNIDPNAGEEDKR